MSEMDVAINAASPVALEININHRYKAGETGVIEFRIRFRTILDSAFARRQTAFFLTVWLY